MPSNFENTFQAFSRPRWTRDLLSYSNFRIELLNRLNAGVSIEGTIPDIIENVGRFNDLEQNYRESVSIVEEFPIVFIERMRDETGGAFLYFLDSNNTGQDNLIEKFKSLASSVYDPFSIKAGDIVIWTREGVKKTFEVVGVRGSEVAISESNTRRRQNTNIARKRELIRVGSSWPALEEDEVVESDFSPSLFYRDYQVGVEVEGEFYLHPDRIMENSGRYFNIQHDGSIYQQKDGYLLELTTPIIKSPIGEKKFFSSLEKITVADKKNKFSCLNSTAGTHIHLDIRNPERFVRRFNLPTDFGEMNPSYYLTILNSVEFEKYFFSEYFKYFHMAKFWNRLNNTYCQSFLPLDGIDKVKTVDYQSIESEKLERGKYRWLNFRSLDDGMGIEFRIFPYITTVSGMRSVLRFTQRVVYEYMECVCSEESLLPIYRMKSNFSYRAIDRAFMDYLSENKTFSKKMRKFINSGQRVLDWKNSYDKTFELDKIFLETGFYDYAYEKEKTHRAERSAREKAMEEMIFSSTSTRTQATYAFNPNFGPVTWDEVSESMPTPSLSEDDLRNAREFLEREHLERATRRLANNPLDEEPF